MIQPQIQTHVEHEKVKPVPNVSPAPPTYTSGGPDVAYPSPHPTSTMPQYLPVSNLYTKINLI